MYGRINNNEIEYFHPYKGGVLIDGRIIINPTEEQMNGAGWYKVVTLAEDGTDHIENGVIKHYTSAHKVYVPTTEDEIARLKQRLADTDYCVIKIAEGVATKEDYADILAERASIRKQINELEVQL